MVLRKIKSVVLKLIPWAITVVACYVAFKEVNWEDFFHNLANCSLPWILLAFLATSLSYILRGLRWTYFFHSKVLSYLNAVRVLILGFFMNNILPARTGELVRAHVGASFAKEKRTLVLATIASERLIDGLVLSLMFVVFVVGLGTQKTSLNLLYVVGLFGVATAGVILLLISRKKIYPLINALGEKFNHRASGYAADRIETFIEGLTPLASLSRLPVIIFSSLAIWFIELSVFWAISEAYGVEMDFSGCVLFLVTVNFSSLIPAAPGGVGVIEAVTSHVLIESLGVSRELALTMVLTQHVIQYLVVGIPGSIIMFTWKSQLKKMELEV